MQTQTHPAPPSKKRLLAARLLAGLPALFLLVDAVFKLAQPRAVVEGTLKLGYPEGVIVPLGIVLHELLSNVLKHAFPDGRSGDVRVALRAAPAGHVTLRVADTGVGLPADLDVHQTASLGWQLVCALAEQLGGGITVAREGGTAVTLTFPFPTDTGGG